MRLVQFEAQASFATKANNGTLKEQMRYCTKEVDSIMDQGEGMVAIYVRLFNY